MTETTVQYKVGSEYLRGTIWMKHLRECPSRQEAEMYYDDIVRLELAYGTPRHPRMLRRTIVTSDWTQVDRRA